MRVSAFLIIDETMIQIGCNDAWLWVAIELLFLLFLFLFILLISKSTSCYPVFMKETLERLSMSKITSSFPSNNT
jgi:hypothetical protein